MIILAILIGSGILIYGQNMPVKENLFSYLNENYMSYGFAKNIPSNSDLHTKRNVYNFCPSKLSNIRKNDVWDLSTIGDEYEDHIGLRWIQLYEWVYKSDNKKGSLHNPNGNRVTLRGADVITAGCQCTYFKDTGLLDDSSAYMGTFDYGFYYKGIVTRSGFELLKAIESGLGMHDNWDIDPHEDNSSYEYYLTTQY
jgi:hypothetical protein